MTMTTDILLSNIPLQLPASANASSNNSALVKFSQTGSDPVQNVQSPTDTKTEWSESLAITVTGYIPSTFSSCTTRNGSIGNLVNTPARSNEAHNNNVQLQVRQLEHEADARFHQRQRELLSRCSKIS